MVIITLLQCVFILLAEWTLFIAFRPPTYLPRLCAPRPGGPPPIWSSARARESMPAALSLMEISLQGLAVAEPAVSHRRCRAPLGLASVKDPRRWFGFGGEVCALNARAALLLGRTRGARQRRGTRMVSVLNLRRQRQPRRRLNFRSSGRKRTTTSTLTTSYPSGASNWPEKLRFLAAISVTRPGVLQ